MQHRAPELNPDGTVSYWSVFANDWIVNARTLMPGDYDSLEQEERERVATHLRAAIVGVPCVKVWHASENVQQRAYASERAAYGALPQFVYETADARVHARLVTFDGSEPPHDTHHASLDELLAAYEMKSDDLVELNP